MTTPEPGDTHTTERTFTTEEVQQFAALSGDTQPRHTDPDDAGRVMVHGLLTATLPTEIGGALGVLASRMDLSFERPVYTGQPLHCTVTVESVSETDDGRDLTAAVRCERDGGETVLTGTIEGRVRTD